MRCCPQAATLALRHWCWSLVPVGKSWRTRRPARHKPEVPDLLYTASALSSVAFFVKEQLSDFCCGLRKEERKRAVC